MPSPDRNSSGTALGVAWLRAAHQVLDAPPPILDDPIAHLLLGAASIQQIRETAGRFQSTRARALRAHIVLRSRFAEDRLALAVERGVTQYVMLGAGFDTFAYRQPAWAAPLRLIEVDHAASQAAKRERLAAAGIAIPPNVTFAAIDLERDAIGTALGTAGLDLARPTFVSCLGVLVYLSEAAIDGVLRFAAGLPATSEIVFTIARPDDREAASGATERPTVASAASALGEPWRSRLDPDFLLPALRQRGFHDVSMLAPDDARDLYFRDRPDDLPAPRRATIGHAIVG